MVPDCVKATDPYAWTVNLRPGTYRVTVQGENYSALPQWSIEVATSMVVTAATSNVTFNVDDPLAVKVSGVITLNGGLPATSGCYSTGTTYRRASLVFTHSTNSHYSDSTLVPDCVKATDPYAWTVNLRPGVYDVTVQGENYSALPQWSVNVATRLRVQ